MDAAATVVAGSSQHSTYEALCSTSTTLTTATRPRCIIKGRFSGSLGSLLGVFNPPEMPGGGVGRKKVQSQGLGETCLLTHRRGAVAEKGVEVCHPAAN